MTTGEQAFLSILCDSPRPQDRRRSHRTPTGSLATIRQIVNADALNPIHVLIMDVSAGGLGLRCPINMVRGGLFRIDVEDHAEPYSVNVKVVSSRRRRDGSYEIGTRYVSK
jgi:hypothetical protein